VTTILFLCTLLAFFSLGKAIADAQDIAPPPPKAQGAASYYGESYRGQIMANGERFNPNALTCAAWEWPLGSILRVTYAPPFGDPREVLVTVTDRGPAKRLNRIIDLSEEAFAELAPIGKGVITVTIELIETPEASAAATDGHRLPIAMAIGAAPVLPIYHPMHAEIQLVASGAAFLAANFLWRKWKAA
jgi:rare lipoprotein A (peptidoglycan hydrolase)